MQHDRNKVEEFKQMYRLVDTVGNDIAGDSGAAMQAYAEFYSALLQSSLDRYVSIEDESFSSGACATCSGTGEGMNSMILQCESCNGTG